jgi:hypothetical protein
MIELETESLRGSKKITTDGTTFVTGSRLEPERAEEIAFRMRDGKER